MTCLRASMGLDLRDFLSREETLAQLPALEPEELRGGVVYYDGQFDDARLLIHLAMTAADHGATLANYFPATQLLRDADGYVNGLTARDEENERKVHDSGTDRGECYGGVYGHDETDGRCQSKQLMAPSQGIHLVFDRSFLKGDTALMVPRTSDGRVLFVIPWHGHAVAGTTDTPVDAPAWNRRRWMRRSSSSSKRRDITLAGRRRARMCWLCMLAFGHW